MFAQMLTARKYWLYSTPEQEGLLKKHFGWSSLA